jgi:hypothetical protein
MRASDFTSSKYLSASDFGNQPTHWIIAAVASEIIGRDDPQEKPVLQPRDRSGKPAGRGLVLNVTNLRTLSRAFGDEMESWVGQTVCISAVWVAFHGEQVRGIRVMPGVATLQAAGGSGRDALEDDFIPY